MKGITPKYWMKTLGLRAQPAADDWASTQHGARKVTLAKEVMFPYRPSMKPGDYIVYYGVGYKRIFAEGVVTSLPFEDDSFVAGGRVWPWWVKVDLGHRRKLISKGVPVEDISVDGRTCVGLCSATATSSYVRQNTPRRCRPYPSQNESNIRPFFLSTICPPIRPKTQRNSEPTQEHQES